MKNNDKIFLNVAQMTIILVYEKLKLLKNLYKY